MLSSSQIDELLVATKNLSNQILSLSLALSQGAGTCEAAAGESRSGSSFLFENAESVGYVDAEKQKSLTTRAAMPALPDPRLVRRIIRQRQLRDRFFDNGLFNDPVWDMLLDLAAATSEYRQVSVTSLCIASRVPPSTALRWIALMTEQGLLRRIEDPLDRRRIFISLSDDAMNAIARYFDSIGSDAKMLI